MAVRASALTIYFNLFNKLLGQDPKTQQDKIKEIKANRTISKKKKNRMLDAASKSGDIDEEDNKVIELVLKGVNINGIPIKPNNVIIIIILLKLTIN